MSHRVLLAALVVGVALAPLGVPTRALAAPVVQDPDDELEEVLEEAESPKDLKKKFRDLQQKAKERQELRAQNSIKPADRAQVKQWFTMCDDNLNGWLSFSETAFSLRFKRDRFQAFDDDRDGRLRQSELDAYYMYSVLHTGKFLEPRTKRPDGPPPMRTPEKVLNAYDSNLDRGLSESELERILADYERANTSAERVLKSLDTSDDDRLQLNELDGLQAILFPVVLDPVATEDTTTKVAKEPMTIERLFGTVEPRGLEPGATYTPPLILGPVSHFRRLDLDNDGFITLDDLEALMRPIRVPVRAHTVINTLDKNGDFRLSEKEFLGSLTDVSK